MHGTFHRNYKLSIYTESVQMTRILNSAKAATCSHLQPLGPIPTSSFSPENLQHSPAEKTGEFSTFSGGSKWLQVAAESQWLQAAASGCKWLSDRSRILQSSGMLP